MATVNEKILDLIIGHAVDLSQYSNGVVRRMLAILAKADQDLLTKLQTALERLPTSNFTLARLEHAMSDIRVVNRVAVTRFTHELTQEMRALADVEAEFQVELIRSTFPPEANVALRVIDATQAYTAALARPFQGRLLKEWGESIEAGRMTRIRDAIRIGYVEGQTIDEMVRKLRGTRAAGFADGILSIETRNAEAVVRTAIQHMAAVTRERFYDQNEELIEAKVWVSTLDSRTTNQCQIRDGKHYTVDNKPIDHKVPWLSGPGQLHWNCRSTSVPVIKNWDDLGLKLPIQKRASMSGDVPQSQTYLQWLARQSAARQDQVLGPTRGALLRDGKLPMEKFWNDKGLFLTLNELRSRNIAAFRAAGL
jgi:SPP1 gp7 family putative phage head morphogenesis protein